ARALRRRERRSGAAGLRAYAQSDGVGSLSGGFSPALGARGGARLAGVCDRKRDGARRRPRPGALYRRSPRGRRSGTARGRRHSRVFLLVELGQLRMEFRLRPQVRSGGDRPQHADPSAASERVLLPRPHPGTPADARVGEAVYELKVKSKSRKLKVKSRKSKVEGSKVES